MPVAYPSWDLSQLLQKQKELSEAQKHHPSKMGTMVFPGAPVTTRFNIGLGRDDIAKFQSAIMSIVKDNDMQASPVTFVPTGILIVIDYRLPSKDEHHQTGYI